MNLVTGFDRRHPRSVIIIRVLVTAWRGRPSSTDAKEAAAVPTGEDTPRRRRVLRLNLLVLLVVVFLPFPTKLVAGALHDRFCPSSSGM